MRYSTFEPSPELQQFIKCFWTLEDEGVPVPAKQRVVPDGCMEMIFHYGDLYQQFFENGTSILQPRYFVFGQISNYIEISPTGKSGIISARFMPDGLMPFLTVPISSLENKAVALADLFGEEGESLGKKVLRAEGTNERIQLIEKFLLTLLEQRYTVNTIIKACVETIFESGGNLEVIELAEKMNLNRRSLERKFSTAVGMSPKQLSKVVRLQATLKKLHQKEFATLTSLAHENGYYDQAHFIKDFREFTGVSPKEFFTDNLKLSSLFISDQ